MSTKLSIIVPAFNEERTIERLVRRVIATPFPIQYELVLVDDGSQDRTLAIQQKLRQRCREVPMRVLRNRTNAGRGSCIRHGLRHATGDLVVVQDGDLEYDPRDIPKLLGPVLEGRADAVFGSRFLHRPWPEGMAWPNYAANQLLTWLTNRLYHLRLTDMEGCYKIVRRDVLERLCIQAERFECEPELTAKLARSGARIAELPISYHGRTRREGKKIRPRDFFLAVWALFRYRSWSPGPDRPRR